MIEAGAGQWVVRNSQMRLAVTGQGNWDSDGEVERREEKQLW